MTTVDRDMTTVEALELTKRVCGEFRGNLQDHTAIQQALQIVLKECEQSDTPDPAEPKEKKEPDGNKKT